MVTSNISLMKASFGANPHKPFLRAAIDNKPVLMPACVGAPLRRALREGQPRREASERKAMGLSLYGEGGCQATEQWGVMENNSWLNQDGEVVPALEALDALEDIVVALDAKIDYLDSRLSRAETRLEEIVAQQD